MVEGSPHTTLVFEKNGGSVNFKTGSEEANFVLIAGKPINEPIVQHGPFVMNTKEEIMEAIMDFQKCRNGFERYKDWSSEIGKRRGVY